jgi:hypothetical protein
MPCFCMQDLSDANRLEPEPDALPEAAVELLVVDAEPPQAASATHAPSMLRATSGRASWRRDGAGVDSGLMGICGFLVRL